MQTSCAEWSHSVSQINLDMKAESAVRTACSIATTAMVVMLPHIRGKFYRKWALLFLHSTQGVSVGGVSSSAVMRIFCYFNQGNFRNFVLTPGKFKGGSVGGWGGGTQPATHSYNKLPTKLRCRNFELVSTDWVCKSVPIKHVKTCMQRVFMYSNWPSILHATVAGWEGGLFKLLPTFSCVSQFFFVCVLHTAPGSLIFAPRGFVSFLSFFEEKKHFLSCHIFPPPRHFFCRHLLERHHWKVPPWLERRERAGGKS